jgi:hypothetical protein
MRRFTELELYCCIGPPLGTRAAGECERDFMSQLELSEDEESTLNDLLRGVLENLEVEIHRTDGIQFKEVLRRRHDVLEQLLAKLSSARRVPA